MSDVYDYLPSFFSSDPRTGAPTYEQLVARQKIAAALATRNRPYPKTIGEGLTALGEGLGEGYAFSRAAADEKAYRQQADETVRRLTGEGATPAAPRPATGGASLESADPATQAYAYAPPDTGPVFDPAKLSPEDRQKLEQARAYSGSQMPIEEWKQRIARNESGSRKDAYTLVGERSRRGDYPYGKYQVMGENIPKWTKQYVGREMTPEEFLNDPNAQETVANGQGGKYLAKYGPEGAGAAWFAGEKGMNDPNRKDTLGTHVAEYKRRFNIPLVSRDQVVTSAARSPDAIPAAARPTAFSPDEDQAPVQVASLGGGIPTPDTASDPREAIAQSLAGPQPSAQPQQAPIPPPVQVAQAPQQQLPIGRPLPTPQGPPPPPEQTPMTQREMEIRRAIGATTDPTLRGRLEPFAERMEAERKFKDAQNMKLWEKDVAAYEKRTDPTNQAQLRKLQDEEALRKQYGNLPQAEVVKRIAESKDTADKSITAFNAIRTARSALDAGAITGFGANQRLDWAKLNQLMGLEDKGNVIANTEVFRSSMAPAVASMLKATVGTTQISNTDRDFAEKAAGGQITLDASSIKRLLDVSHRLSLETMGKHQTTMDAIYRDNPQAQALFGVDPPAPQHHVERLIQNKDNPEYIKDFDAKYYRGAAQRIINRGY